MSGVRDYRPEDAAELRAIHAAQGIDYRFPDLDSPLFFVRKVREDMLGNVKAALVLKVCAEAHLLLGEQGPREKMTAIRELQDAAFAEAWARGLDEVHAAVPPIGFDRRLKELGWARDRDGWTLWSRSTR